MAIVVCGSRNNDDWLRLASQRLVNIPCVTLTRQDAPHGDNLRFDFPQCTSEHWEIAFDGGDTSRAGNAAMWRDQRYAEAALLARSPDDRDASNASVLDLVRVKVVAHDTRKTRARLLDAAAWMPARVAVRRLAGIPDPRFDFSPTPALAAWQQAALPAACLRNLVGRLWRERLEEIWTIGIVDRSVEDLLEDFKPDDVMWLAPRDSGYLADPFAVRTQDTDWLFAEAYDYCSRKGYLVANELSKVTQDGALATVLEMPYHLSFPQVLEHDGAWWMVPEATGSGRITLYRADHFPWHWVEDSVLLEDFAGADPTLHHQGNDWWLFATDHADQDETTLHLFHARDLRGPWQPHHTNPVKSDIGSARPAGPLFYRGGDLIRPAQDCRERYGGAIALNRVVALSPEAFVEETIGHLAPDPDGPFPAGLHSLTALGHRTLVDGKREVFSWRRWAFGLRQLLRSATSV